MRCRALMHATIFSFKRSILEYTNVTNGHGGYCYVNTYPVITDSRRQPYICASPDVQVIWIWLFSKYSNSNGCAHHDAGRLYFHIRTAVSPGQWGTTGHTSPGQRGTTGQGPESDQHP